MKGLITSLKCKIARKDFADGDNATTLLFMKKPRGLILLFDSLFLRFSAIIISLILSLNVVAQNRDTIDFKYKKLNIPPVTSLTDKNQFFFFSSDNLLWFSTEQGLTSYDGIETISYYPDTSESIKYGLSNIMAMAEDKNKNLWIASGTSDYHPVLAYFNTNTKKLTKISSDKKGKSMPGKYIKDMFLDNKGLLWMSTYECGFNIYNTIDSSIEYYNIYSDMEKGCKNEDNNLNFGTYMAPDFNDADKMWVGTIEGIFLFDLKTKTAHRRFEFNKPAKIHSQFNWHIMYMDIPNDSIICIGTDYHGMGIYNIKRNTITMFSPFRVPKNNVIPYTVFPDGSVPLLLFSVAKKSADQYYLYYFNSLPLIFNCRTQKYIQLKNPDLTKEIKKGFAKLSADKKGNLWIGEWKNLYVISNELNVFNSRESREINPFIYGERLYGLVWDKEIKNYYATFLNDSVVYQLDSNFQPIKKISTPFLRKGNYIKLYQDIERNVWAINWSSFSNVPSSVSLYKHVRRQFEPIENIYPKLSSLKKMYRVTSDNKGNLIFSNKKGDLFFLNLKTLKLDSVPFPKVDTSLQFKSIGAPLHFNSNCNCVFVSNGTNVFQYNLEKKSGRVFIWDSSTLLKKDTYSSFSYDADGQIWVYTRGKIQIYDRNTFKQKRELVLNHSRNERFNVFNLEPGPRPYMFIGLEEGMALYNYEANTFRLFDKENGLLYDYLRNTNFVNNTYFSGYINITQYIVFDKLLSLTNERIPRINTVAAYIGKIVSLLDFSSNRIQLDYKHNTIGISFSSIEYLLPERIQYAFRLSGLENDWKFSDYKSREIVYANLAPGKYVFQLKAQVLGGNWQQSPVELYITITPPFWQTWWFRILAVLLLIGVAYYFIRKNIERIRRKEQLKSLHEKELLELEAKALRAQMNPHFIFNSLNSIKSLINKNENDKAAGYLTTFSKLIRTLFQNSDKREVSLFEEIETCKLYTQLERMRFGDKIEFIFNVDETIDLKDIKVPALILQPFIENAIWHGLIPKETGGNITVTVKQNNGTVECIIDDDGIGRELSKQYKVQYEATHQSKGIGLTQSRLELDKILNEREDSILIIDKKNEDIAEGTKVIITFGET